jgi:molybdopterin molybdotransferase
MLAALIEAMGGSPACLGIFPDRFEALQEGLHQAMEECQAVVITAGSSASTRDLTSRVIQEAGKPGVLVHGVNLKPGKPTILGVCDGKAVLGLPGNPVSAFVVARTFLVPVIERLLGIEGEPLRPQVSAWLTINLASQAGREEWVPVILSREGNSFRADPVFYKSNLIFSLARAGGLLHIPADATGLSAGEQVQVTLL